MTITSGFWAPRREINVTRSIPTMHDLLEANGRMNNFRRLVGKSSAAQSGPVFSDSDVYKWTEAVGFVLQSGDRPALRATADKIIDEVIAVQEHPSLKLIACGSSGPFMATYLEWDREVLKQCYDYVDGLSLHRYFGNNERDTGGDTSKYLVMNLSMERQIAETVAVCDLVRGHKRSPNKLWLSFDEWNVWYRTTKGGCGRWPPAGSAASAGRSVQPGRRASGRGTD